jgi:hypothetical protein
VARARGDHWKLTDDEAKELAICSSRVAVKYSELFERFSEEIALVSTTAMIVWPRAEKDAELAAARAKPVEAEVVG